MNDQQRAAMQMALEALEYYKNPTAEFYERIAVELEDKAITALRSALAQPKGEPVAWLLPNGEPSIERFNDSDMPLYTIPPSVEAAKEKQNV